MADSRKVAPVTLTAEQRAQLERLWFYYGNYGPQTTPGNHSFIQRLIENGIDERPLYNKRTPKSQRPTPECEEAVDKILSGAGRRRDDSGSAGSSGGRRLRIVRPSGKEQTLPSTDPDLKAILEEMNLRQGGMREGVSSEDDTPDAA